MSFRTLILALLTTACTGNDALEGTWVGVGGAAFDEELPVTLDIERDGRDTLIVHFDGVEHPPLLLTHATNRDTWGRVEAFETTLFDEEVYVSIPRYADRDCVGLFLESRDAAETGRGPWFLGDPEGHQRPDTCPEP